MTGEAVTFQKHTITMGLDTEMTFGVRDADGEYVSFVDANAREFRVEKEGQEGFFKAYVPLDGANNRRNDFEIVINTEVGLRLRKGIEAAVDKLLSRPSGAMGQIREREYSEAVPG